MITWMNESKTLANHISCECKCILMQQNLIQIIDGITVNVNVSVKNIYVKKIMFGILLMQLWKWKIFSKYNEWCNDYLWLICKIIWWRNEKKAFCKKNYYFLLVFLLMTIALLVAVNKTLRKTFIAISQHKQ